MTALGAGEREPSIREQAGPISTAILLISLVGLSISLTIPLLALEMERMGVSSAIAGVNTAFAGIGNLAIVPFIPRLAARFGLRPVIGVSVAVLLTSIIAFKLIPDIGVWFVLRFLMGAALGSLFTLSEFWINAAAPPSKRGLVMGIYATALSFGFALGPAILGVVGTVGWLPYLVAAAISLSGLIPVVFSQVAAPALDRHAKAPVFAFIVAAPSATLAALVFGAIETGAVAHLAVVGVRSGYSEAASAILVSIFAAGNIVSQVPIGLLADRMDKRVLLLLIAVVSLVLVAVLAFTFPVFWLMAAILFVFGGVVGALYTVGLAHLGARYGGIDLASANAAFVMLYSSGLIIGPPLLGVGMDVMGAPGFSVMMGALLLPYALIVASRMRAR
jgi:MFS family permease